VFSLTYLQSAADSTLASARRLPVATGWFPVQAAAASCAAAPGSSGQQCWRNKKLGADT